MAYLDITWLNMAEHSISWHNMAKHGLTWQHINHSIHENMSYLKIVFTIFHTVGEVCTYLISYALGLLFQQGTSTGLIPVFTKDVR